MKSIIPLTSAVLGTAAIGIYLYHETLRSRLITKSQHGHLPRSLATHITTAPESVFTAQTTAVYDSASTAVPRAQLPNLSTHDLLTRFLQRNMSRFARLPQAYILRAMSTAAEKPGFDAARIQALEFREGDSVCGAYRVVLRTAERVEFALKPMGVIQGRLVVSLTEDGDGRVVFMNETLMWRPVGEKVVMPLETGVGRWVHELTAWWMLDSGVRYLMGLKE
ncbi:uncharacterized protein ACLA_059340 [Aspergillus clavatus NRRL 1]|uniref:Uncharacterized protein n=1 Tax=Aspergillus clavatus (strain ATCC 1007 / CBS 513.65 / DSM 816 / NCTC 3887 / NRRL 1 / QM 1276 / 107) TaxID=344612 RepID=A1C4D0_ASPCL|nr:uncharacterized protein ACLA_059340 [Aspergillus clavatus NRRL 1]EAW15270.1 conserved hypothetical protein [Aspergillus clavatus NRRL 1]